MRRRKKDRGRVRRKIPVLADSGQTPLELKEALEAARIRYSAGEIDQDELYAIADQYVAAINKKNRELALKHGLRYHRVKRSDVVWGL